MGIRAAFCVSAILILASTLSPSAVPGATIQVPADHPTIPAGGNAASSGVTVLFAAGGEPVRQVGTGQAAAQWALGPHAIYIRQIGGSGFDTAFSNAVGNGLQSWICHQGAHQILTGLLSCSVIAGMG